VKPAHPGQLRVAAFTVLYICRTKPSCHRIQDGKNCRGVAFSPGRQCARREKPEPVHDRACPDFLQPGNSGQMARQNLPPEKTAGHDSQRTVRRQIISAKKGRVFLTGIYSDLQEKASIHGASGRYLAYAGWRIRNRRKTRQRVPAGRISETAVGQ
jgi:hypothetical protein